MRPRSGRASSPWLGRLASADHPGSRHSARLSKSRACVAHLALGLTRTREQAAPRIQAESQRTPPVAPCHEVAHRSLRRGRLRGLKSYTCRPIVAIARRRASDVDALEGGFFPHRLGDAHEVVPTAKRTPGATDVCDLRSLLTMLAAHARCVAAGASAWAGVRPTLTRRTAPNRYRSL